MGAMQTPKRLFLGWGKPGLKSVVDHLWDRYAEKEVWDLSNVTLVVPAASARRRLLVLLAERGEGWVFTPPQIVTPGALPELLYTPVAPVADAMTALFARVYALQQAEEAVLREVVYTPPDKDDWQGWVNLAEELGQLHESLAAEGLTVAQVGPRLEEAIPDFMEGARWQALAQLQGDYEAVLQAQGLNDLQLARLQAAEQGSCSLEGDLYLVALTDLTRMLRLMLAPLTRQVRVLVHAPESQADAFDDWGAVSVKAWMDRLVEVQPGQIHWVDRPRDQASKALALFQQVRRKQPELLDSVDAVTIGLGDAKLATRVKRTFEWAGIAARPAQVQSMAQARPVLFLQSMASYLSGRKWDDLASLLRHPDVESYLRRQLGDQTATRGSRHWQTLLDEYLTEHLQGRIAAQWLGDAKVNKPLKQVVQAVDELIPKAAEGEKPLPQWGGVMGELLRTLYDDVSLNRATPDDDALYHALSHLANVLENITALNVNAPSTPSMRLAEAMQFVVAQVSRLEIPSPVAVEGAVELLGWLELPLDDAPVLILTGVNEGLVPSSRNPDAFLPDKVRKVLGLLDNQRRYARDAAHLTAMLHSRKVMHLVAGRRGDEGDPLIPSRLLLACQPTVLAERVLDFYQVKHDEDQAQSAPGLMMPGSKVVAGSDRFTVPLPVPPREPINQLRVTAFRDYLMCPYRFFLKHVLKLKAMGEVRPEMDALHFGTLAHEVLEALGRSPVIESKDHDEVRHFLWKDLEKRVSRRYGDKPAPAIVVQTIQLKERLAVFARWQAEQVSQGWQVMEQGVERELKGTVMVDGQPFAVTGRMDRMDRNKKTGEYRLLDYKTGDSGIKPKHTHRQRGKWVDLQLPLYRLLVQEKKIEKINLGYVLLPKKLQEIGLAEADWTLEELEEAMEVAVEVMRKVRAGVFWPPGEPVDDELAALCMDEALDRTQRIAHSEVIGQGEHEGER